MNKKLVFLVALTATFSGGTGIADTLELANGQLHEGSFVGSSNGIIMFDTGAGIEAFPQDQVVGLYFSDGVATAESVIEANSGGQIIVPAGTRLVIRTTDNIDSRQHSAGHRFRGQLEGALVVDGVTAIPRGSFVHGRISQASQGRRVAGSSQLAAEFTDIMVNDQLLPISTGTLAAETGGEAARTVGRTARSAAVGGLIGGSSGARTGARVGVGASILTSGASINIPRGTIVETTLSAPLTITL